MTLLLLGTRATPRRRGVALVVVGFASSSPPSASPDLLSKPRRTRRRSGGSPHLLELLGPHRRPHAAVLPAWIHHGTARPAAARAERGACGGRGVQRDEEHGLASSIMTLSFLHGTQGF